MPKDKKPAVAGLACPIPIEHYPVVTLAHGGGGKFTHQLIEKMFAPTFANDLLAALHDGAVIGHNTGKLAFSTDSYVIKPLFFPGGDIGSLAVNGTVNDLAMCGARPAFLSAGFIIEEGLAMETLWQVVQSMKKAADAAGVQIVTGDTKVVDKGKGDGLFINTAGIGFIEHEQNIDPRNVCEGDVIIINGDIGRHGMAIMAQREGLAFESTIVSDCAPLAGLVQDLLNNSIEMHCLRDLTRGGLTSALVEIAESADVHINIEEDAVPVQEEVQGGCEILGLDPMYVANEGRFIAFVPQAEADKTLAVMRAHPQGRDARRIGVVEKTVASDKLRGMVTLKSRIGARRILDMLSGEQLPRIC